MNNQLRYKAMYNRHAVYASAVVATSKSEKLMSQSQPLGARWPSALVISTPMLPNGFAEGPSTCPVTAGFSSSYFGSDALEDSLDVGPVERNSEV